MSIDVATICFAFAAFLSTTVDDLVVLITFQCINWGDKEKTFQDKMRDSFYISLGQFLSYTLIIVLSLVGLLLGHFIKEEYISCIGIIPLALGCYMGWETYKESRESTELSDDMGEKGEVTSVNNSSLEISLVSEENSDEDNFLSKFIKILFGNFLNPITLKVAIAGALVGSDNICVYIAFFAKLDKIDDIFLILGIFYTMLGFYIWIGAYIARKSPIATTFINAWSPYFIPPLLVGLGLYILSSSIIAIKIQGK